MAVEGYVCALQQTRIDDDSAATHPEDGGNTLGNRANGVRRDAAARLACRHIAFERLCTEVLKRRKRMTMEQVAHQSGKPKKTMLVKHADVLVTMDGARRELRDGGLYIEDNRIVAVGPTAQLPPSAI